jgi:hypothetical protein
MKWNELSRLISFVIFVFVSLPLFILIFGFSLKAEARWPMARRVDPAGVEVPPLVRAPPTKKRR